MTSHIIIAKHVPTAPPPLRFTDVGGIDRFA